MMQRRLMMLVATLLITAVAGGSIWYAVGRKQAPISGVPVVSSGGPAELTLSPLKPTADGVDPVGAYILTSVKPLTVAAVQQHLAVEPPVALTVAARGTAGQEFLVTPDRALEANRIYRFRMAPAADGVARAHQWSFQTRAEFRLVGTLPRNQGTSVPVNTGIELIFTHDDYVDVGSLFSITPAVQGRFERHKRTLAFVPKDSLAPGTIYTVTLKKGLTRTGGEGRISEDIVFTFETNPAEQSAKNVSFFQGPTTVQQFPVADAPFFQISAKSSQAPVDVAVYKYKDTTTFVKALEKSDQIPSWAYYSRSRYREEPTGLPRVASFSAQLKEYPNAGLVLLFPDPLPQGYYLADLKQGDGQLQVRFEVTDLSSFAAITSSNTLVWLNDLKTGKPLAGGKVTFTGGTGSATTDDSGLAAVATPPDAQARSQQGVYLLAQSGDREAVIAAKQESYYRSSYARDQTRPHLYWRYLSFDRPIYRPTDKVNLFGVIRPREPGAPAVSAVTALVTRGDYRGLDEQPISLVKATFPVENGTFTGSLDLPGLKPGFYEVQLRLGEDYLLSQYLQVQNYTKPAYQLTVTAPNRAVFSGDPVTYTVKATFFEGTPVPGLTLEYNNQKGGTGKVVTGEDGTAMVTVTHLSQGSYGPSYAGFSVRAVLPETGEMTSGTSIQVFGADLVLDSAIKVEADGAVLSGKLSRVDLTAMNAGTGSEYRGLPSAGRDVSITLFEESWIKTDAGEFYDFIAKTVQKRYDYRQQSNEVGTFTVVTAADGRFSRKLAVDPKKSYRAVIRVVDGKGSEVSDTRSFSGQEYKAEARSRSWYHWIRLQPDKENHYEYALGEAAQLTMMENDVTFPERPRGYLYYTARLGLQEYQVQDGPTFRYALKAADVPNTTIRGVYFDGRTYHESLDFTLRLDPKERELNVTVKTDKESYRPGDMVTANVAVSDRAGKPLKATVNLSAVDEALFAVMDQRVAMLADLYGRTVPSGVLRTVVSHVGPVLGNAAEKGGDGGEPRTDFKDAPYFATVTTDNAGKATVRFQVPDNLTAWRLTWQAVETGTMQAASGSVKVPVRLPFFVETVQSESYLAGDQPAVLARTFGTGLTSGQRVKVSGKLEGPVSHVLTDVEAKAFEMLSFSLPRLDKAGRYTVTLQGEGPNGLKDAIAKPVTVVDTYLRQKVVSFSLLAPETKLSGPDEGMVDLLFTDYERGEYLRLLQHLRWQMGNRFEQKLARTVASRLLSAHFKGKLDYWPPEPDLNTMAYQAPNGSVGILPYADGDLTLSALAVDLLPNGFDRAALEVYFQKVLDDDGAGRDRKVTALYGMAALDRPVLREARELLKATNLTLDERLWLLLALAELGDLEGARPLYRALLPENAEKLGGQFRVKSGADREELLTRTARLGVLAAKLGEPEAPGFAGYMNENAPDESLLLLEAALMADAALPQVSAQPVSFTYVLDGKTAKRELKPGEFLRTAVPAKSLASMQFREVQGKVGVTTVYEAPLKQAELRQQEGFTVKRSYQLYGGGESSSFKMGDLVKVKLSYKVPDTAPGGDFELSDYLPSGLRLIDRPWQQGIKWQNPGDPAWPLETDGQRVTFWVGRFNGALTYYARVITPGQYTAEQPVMQHQRSGIIYGHGERQQVTLR